MEHKHSDYLVWAASTTDRASYPDATHPRCYGRCRCGAERERMPGGSWGAWSDATAIRAIAREEPGVADVLARAMGRARR